MPYTVNTPHESWELAFSLTLLLVLFAFVYLRGRRHLPQAYLHRIPTWRAASYCFGLFLTWVAVASPIASFDGKMLTAHMVQHLLLMTFAPPLIWLGTPMMPLLHGWRPVRWVFSFPPVRRTASLLGHPVVCWLSAAAALVTWHVPALFELGMQSPIWHLTEHATFFASGLLFWWPVVQPWPSVPRWPSWSMLLYLFLATLPCDVLSALLVFSDRIAYPMYLCSPGQTAISALEDQQCAAALMWTCVTVVLLAAGTVLSLHLLAPHKSAHPVEA